LFKPRAIAARRVRAMHKPGLIFMAVALAATVGASPGAPVTQPDMSWLAGDWCQEKGASVIEEHWLPARGGVMLSVGRTLVAGQLRTFEFLRIDQRGNATVFIAQPDGDPPTTYALAGSGPGWARFENPAHDFPKTVEYRRTPTGLHAEIGGPGKDDRDRVIPFDYLPAGGTGCGSD
jgi:hypothetical protein